MRPKKSNDAIIALEEAARLRQKLGIKIYDAICPYDCAERLGLEIRFVDIPSLEGMYAKGSPAIILISTLRPSGRASYTCAHEIGHHVFNHGTRVDTDLASSDAIKSQEEFLAQTFAGFFLMPKMAIQRAFTIRRWNIASPTPEQIYRLANWFGVGYETIISHMEISLRILSPELAKNLRRVSLAQIKVSITGESVTGNLILADEFWTGRAIDVQVGDQILCPEGTLTSGDKSEVISDKKGVGVTFQAIAPGMQRLHNPISGWSSFMRVSRASYTGRSIFRFLEDPEYDN